MQAHLIGIPSIFFGYHTKNIRNTNKTWTNKKTWNNKKARDTGRTPGPDILVDTEEKPIEKLLPPPGYETSFDPARAVGRIQRILDALRDFSQSQPENTVWRAHISGEGGLEVEELRPEELDPANRIGIVRRDALERIRALELVSVTFYPS